MHDYIEVQKGMIHLQLHTNNKWSEYTDHRHTGQIMIVHNHEDRI